MRISYRHFACPICLRLTTKPWNEAWCAHKPEVELQAYDPNAGILSILTWTRMVEMDPERLRSLITLFNA